MPTAYACFSYFPTSATNHLVLNFRIVTQKLIF